MPFKGIWEADFEGILRNNKVNMPTGTNWLNSLLTLLSNVYYLGTEYYSSFFRCAILQPGQHCPKMSTRNVEMEMKEKQCM